MALSGKPRRELGLQRVDGYGTGNADARREATQGLDDRTQGRLLLRDRPQRWEAHLGGAVRASELGIRNRCWYRAAHRDAEHPLREWRNDDVDGAGRCA